LIDLEEVNIQKAILVPPYNIGKPFDVKELKTAMDLVLNMMSELKGERERYRNLVKYTGRCVAVYEAIDNGKDFVFKDFNPAAEHTERVKKEDVLGRRVTEVFPRVKKFWPIRRFQESVQNGPAGTFSHSSL